MKGFILILSFLLAAISADCQSTLKIYIVRHAEKSSEPADNPDLTDNGKQRAQVLMNILKGKNIRHIFSTQVNRTIQTSTPLSEKINVPVKYYNNDTLQAFLQIVISLKKNVLIIGHSNTVLAMLDKLQLKHKVSSIADHDYNNLFIITAKNGKAVNLTETTYGAASLKNQ